MWGRLVAIHFFSFSFIYYYYYFVCIDIPFRFCSEEEKKIDHNMVTHKLHKKKNVECGRKRQREIVAMYNMCLCIIFISISYFYPFKIPVFDDVMHCNKYTNVEYFTISFFYYTYSTLWINHRNVHCGRVCQYVCVCVLKHHHNMQSTVSFLMAYSNIAFNFYSQLLSNPIPTQKPSNMCLCFCLFVMCLSGM